MIPKGTITKRLENSMEALYKEFETMYCQEFLEQKIDRLERARSDRSSILAELFSIFHALGIEHEKGRDNNYYRELVKDIGKKKTLPSYDDLQKKLLTAIYSRFKSYPTPEEYMKRIVSRLTDPEDGWSEDPLRLQILKQFVKYGKSLTPMGYGGNKTIKDYLNAKAAAAGRKKTDLADLGDDIFLLLDNATDEQRKPKGDYGLLKLADDLAHGAFRTEGSTRRGLYLFAIVYDMTYYSGARDEHIDYNTDIEKNLFTDFYANNVLRFITDTYQGNLCRFDPDPGVGIVYKNPVDMIFLYAISQVELSRLDKIQLAAKMIKDLKAAAKEKRKSADPAPPDPDTVFLKGRVFVADEPTYTDSVLRLGKEEFMEYLLANYDYTSRINVMELGASQWGAHTTYQHLLQKITDKGIRLENCNYGLWFADVSTFVSEGRDLSVAAFLEEQRDANENYPELNQENFLEFQKLLLAVNRYIGHTAAEDLVDPQKRDTHTAPSKQKIEALSITDSAKMTRTAMIVAYYYYFNELHLRDPKHTWASFPDLFDVFQSGVNQYLEAGNYQPFSGKNLFDLLVVFSSFAYLNM